MTKTQAATAVDECLVTVRQFGADLLGVIPGEGQICPAATSSLRLGVLHRASVVHAQFALEDAAEVHKAIETRNNLGKVVLRP
ncbi:hypothetical protein [Streptomyces sp. NPDC051684]|uniref:hypothetical protein n=1 Tax=Streptomyces sp. NPDC051684 TaxID=3365670 RepID=UPI0037BB3864